MDLNLTAEELAFRAEVRAFFRDALPADIRAKVVLGQRLSKEELKRWTTVLFAKGWGTPAWSREWGGTGWSSIKQYIFKEELHTAPAPEPLSFNVNMIGPVLIAFGTEEQKRHFLPKIASLDYWFCQGFSEPGAGSDLASLRTQAVRNDDDYLINGQKLWTSTVHHADWCFLLARTDPNARKQQGITYLLMDMKTPGITVRPIITIDGNHETNEMFLENVRVPVANRIGEENKGWDYAKFLLGNERSCIARVGISKMRLERARQLAGRIPNGTSTLAQEPGFRERAAASMLMPSAPSANAATRPLPSAKPPHATSGILSRAAAAGINTRPGISTSPGWPAHSKPSMLTASAPSCYAFNAWRTVVHLCSTVMPARLNRSMKRAGLLPAVSTAGTRRSMMVAA